MRAVGTLSESMRTRFSRDEEKAVVHPRNGFAINPMCGPSKINIGSSEDPPTRLPDLRVIYPTTSRRDDLVDD